MPIDPAKAVKIVLPFLVIRLFILKLKAVKKDIKVFRLTTVELVSSSKSYGLESLVTLPSNKLITLLEYFSASSEL